MAYGGRFIQCHAGYYHEVEVVSKSLSHGLFTKYFFNKSGDFGISFDGYTTIQQANSRSSREEELDVMKEARRKNRFGGSGEIDLSKIGAQRMNE